MKWGSGVGETAQRTKGLPWACRVRGGSFLLCELWVGRALRGQECGVRMGGDSPTTCSFRGQDTGWAVGIPGQPGAACEPQGKWSGRV